MEFIAVALAVGSMFFAGCTVVFAVAALRASKRAQDEAERHVAELLGERP